MRKALFNFYMHLAENHNSLTILLITLLAINIPLALIAILIMILAKLSPLFLLGILAAIIVQGATLIIVHNAVTQS